MAANPANYLGIPITASEANDHLQTNAIIKERIRSFAEDAINNHTAQINKSSFGIPADANRALKAINLTEDGNNFYVFSKDDFLRFFDGDPNDPSHSNLQFTHCIIAVGSLPADDGTKKMGEQTILIAGCTKTGTNTFATNVGGVSLAKVATEHPPRAFAAQITDLVSPS